MSTIATISQQKVLAKAIREEKEINPNWKRRSKAVTVSDGMILCIENPKDATRKKLLELINEFSEVAG